MTSGAGEAISTTQFEELRGVIFETSHEPIPPGATTVCISFPSVDMGDPLAGFEPVLVDVNASWTNLGQAEQLHVVVNENPISDDSQMGIHRVYNLLTGRGDKVLGHGDVSQIERHDDAISDERIELFIDWFNLGPLVNLHHRELTSYDIDQLTKEMRALRHPVQSAPRIKGM